MPAAADRGVRAVGNPGGNSRPGQHLTPQPAEVLPLDRAAQPSRTDAASRPRTRQAPGSFGRRGTQPQPQPGSLDTTIRAASALAACYLRQGDRVGLIDLGRPQLYLAPGAGARHLLRLRHRLIRCAQSAGRTPPTFLPPHLVPAGATVVLLSPLLDDAALQVAATATRRGGLVVAVDMLPRPLLPDPHAQFGQAALAVILAEHRVRTEALTQHGVPVIGWTGHRETAVTLHKMALRPRRRLIRTAR